MKEYGHQTLNAISLRIYELNAKINLARVRLRNATEKLSQIPRSDETAQLIIEFSKANDFVTKTGADVHWTSALLGAVMDGRIAPETLLQVWDQVENTRRQHSEEANNEP